jgi:hypothetical protein
MARFQYAFRPRKHIVRRMIVDACRRLSYCENLRDYEYVGFGGFEFLDFELVHRELQIDAMVSIESEGITPARFEFNAPFAGIRVIHQRALEVLPELLDDARRRIVWLDYTVSLTQEVLQDVETCLRKLASGSLLIVTINAHPPAIPKRSCECVPGTEVREPRLTQLVEQVGAGRVPSDVTEESLAKWGFADALYRTVTGEVPAAIRRREQPTEWQQLFHFRYQDGAYMLTWGGLIVDEGDAARWREAFADVKQCSRFGDPPLMIEVPALTSKEAIRFNSTLPAGAGGGTAALAHETGVPVEDCEAYEALYRWYPPVPTPI